MNKLFLFFIELTIIFAINSAINVINMIYENFDSEAAKELERRLINSIRGKDATKFSRGVRKLRNENT